MPRVARIAFLSLAKSLSRTCLFEEREGGPKDKGENGKSGYWGRDISGRLRREFRRFGGPREAGQENILYVFVINNEYEDRPEVCSLSFQSYPRS